MGLVSNYRNIADVRFADRLDLFVVLTLVALRGTDYRWRTTAICRYLFHVSLRRYRGAFRRFDLRSDCREFRYSRALLLDFAFVAGRNLRSAVCYLANIIQQEVPFRALVQIGALAGATCALFFKQSWGDCCLSDSDGRPHRAVDTGSPSSERCSRQ